MHKKLTIALVLFFACFTYSQSQPSRTIDSLQRILPLAADSSEKFHILYQLADILNFIQPNEALKHALRANALAMDLDDEKAYASSLNLTANIYWAKSEFQQSLEYSMKAKEAAENCGANDILAEVHRTFGKIYTDIGEFSKSSDQFFECLRLYEETDDKDGVSRAFNSIGYLYYEQENYEKALEYYLKSLKISRDNNNKKGIARGLNNVAATHLELKYHDEVTPYLYEAVHINKITGQKLWEGVNYLNIAEVFQNKKQYDSTLHYIDIGKQIFQELNNITKLTSAYNQSSDLHKELGEMLFALDDALRAYELADDNGLQRPKKDAAKRLHELYNTLGDLKNAYKYGMIQFNVKDSLDLEESLTKMANLELQYKFEKQDQESKLVRQRKDFLLVLLGVSVLFILGIVVLLLKRQKIQAKNVHLEKLQLEKEIEYKNKELQLNVMNLIRKNEILSEISKRLISIQHVAVKSETKSAILKVAKDLQNATDQEIWTEFEMRFKEVHGTFYDQLVKKHPDLSPNEQKLCAFLKLNLSTKDISEITGQRTNTIEMARHRLRKKMGISNTQTNLVAYLSKI